MLKKVLDERGYWAKGKNSIISEVATQSANSHDAGVTAYRGKRLVVFEELSRKSTLDGAFLKDITGGAGVSLQVRECHGLHSEMMPWTAKVVLIFNQGNIPKIHDRDIDNLMTRALVIQHRSYFAKTEARYVERAGQPHLFKADRAVMDSIMPSAILNWILPAVAEICAGTFEELPQCQEWKRLLRQDNSDVLQWAAEHVRDEAGARLLLSEAWNSYQASGFGKAGRNDFRKSLKEEYAASVVEDKGHPSRAYLRGKMLAVVEESDME